MDPERARLVVGALLTTGRMEERDREEVRDSLYRNVIELRGLQSDLDEPDSVAGYTPEN